MTDLVEKYIYHIEQTNVYVCSRCNYKILFTFDTEKFELEEMESLLWKIPNHFKTIHPDVYAFEETWGTMAEKDGS